MEITRDYLLEQLEHMRQQYDRACDQIAATRAAIEVLQALVIRLETPPPE